MRRLRGPFAAMLIAAAMAVSPAKAADSVIQGITNAEDLIATPDGRWVIASSMAGGGQARGGILLIEAGARRVTRAELAKAPGTARCPAGFDPAVFASHGVALRSTPSGDTLYVVNHGGREAIERFRLVGAVSGPPRLEWEDCILFPAGGKANSVAVAADGTLFAGNGGQAINEPAGVMGEILTWSEAGGWRMAPGTRRLSWNGLVVTPDGGRIYAATWTERRVYEFVLNGDKPGRTVDTEFLADNVRWSNDGALLVAGQYGEPDEVRACHRSPQTLCALEWGLVRIDPATMTVACRHRQAPGPQFSGATSALAVGRELWVGTLRGQGVLVTAACGGG